MPGQSGQRRLLTIRNRPIRKALIRNLLIRNPPVRNLPVRDLRASSLHGKWLSRVLRLFLERGVRLLVHRFASTTLRFQTLSSAMFEERLLDRLPGNLLCGRQLSHLLSTTIFPPTTLFKRKPLSTVAFLPLYSVCAG